MTQMGQNLLADIWPALESEGAFTEMVYRQVTITTITSTNITSTSLGESLYSTGIDVLLHRFTGVEIDGMQLFYGDLEVRFPKSILSVTPRLNDQPVALGSTFRVMGITEPADGASWALLLRRP